MHKTVKEIQDALLAPFAREDIEFRVCRISAKKNKASVLAYITARGIMQRLDEVFGLENWTDAYEVLQAGVKCKLSVRVLDEWITKEDVAPFTNIEALKGAFSDSLKRAGVKFGIGRYLYDLEESWVDIVPDKPTNAKFPIHYHNSDGVIGYWVEPNLPTWAQPSKTNTQMNTTATQTAPVPQTVTVPEEVNNKLDELLQKKFLTASRYDYYVKLWSDPKLDDKQKDLATCQLQLVEQWGNNVVYESGIDTDLKKDIYRKILAATPENIEQVKAELTRISVLELAA
jgi:hypothetical protein